jgi:hypothetical protein
MMYRTDDGQGWIHVNFGRKGGQLPCAAPALERDNRALGDRCCRMGAKLCDAPAGQDLAGKALTCDMPICEAHAAHVHGQNIDYCPRHAHLAPAPLRREVPKSPQPLQPVVDELRRRMREDTPT